LSWKLFSLDVGCGTRKRGKVNVDINPEVKPDVVCDARFLPFKNKTFEKVYAFNVLEHIKEYPQALSEICRVCNRKVIIRFDKIYNLGNWWTLDHEYIQHGKRLIPVPKIIKAFRLLFRFPTIHSRIFGHAFYCCCNALRKIGLVDIWNYYLYVRACMAPTEKISACLGDYGFGCEGEKGCKICKFRNNCFQKVMENIRK
jgi:predicted SAM-dependent methyltransferase